MKEQRQLERFDIRVPAKIEKKAIEQAVQEKEAFHFETRDISSGGAYFYTEQPLPKGTEVKVDLFLPLDKLRELKEEYCQVHINVTGQVLRSEPAGMAVRFNTDWEISPFANSSINSALWNDFAH